MKGTEESSVCERVVFLFLLFQLTLQFVSLVLWFFYFSFSQFLFVVVYEVLLIVYFGLSKFKNEFVNEWDLLLLLVWQQTLLITSSWEPFFRFRLFRITNWLLSSNPLNEKQGSAKNLKDTILWVDWFSRFSSITLKLCNHTKTIFWIHVKKDLTLLVGVIHEIEDLRCLYFEFVCCGS